VADLGQLSAKLDGDVVTPGDAGWETVRRAWNLAVDQNPAAVALVAGADDVARSLGRYPEPVLGEPIMDTFGTIPAAELVTIHMDPEHPVPGLGNHALIGDLTPDAVDAFVEVAGPDAGSPLLLAELRHAGGALSAPARDGGALPSVDAGFVLNAIGSPVEPAQAEAINRHLDIVCEAVAPWATGSYYLNFAERRAALDTLFPPATHDRLSEIKRRWDPDGVFRANFTLRIP